MAANTNDAKEQVLALLCGDADPWTWGGDGASCRFTFEEDGTGTVSIPRLCVLRLIGFPHMYMQQRN